MCNNVEQNTCQNCIGDILKVILVLQQGVCQNDTCLQTCDRGFLGQNISALVNTRPFVLYTCGNNGTPLAMPISRDPAVTNTSTVFRIEKLDDCCATCRVLAPNEGGDFPYESTDSFFTIDLKCVCIIRCLNDTYVDGV